VRDLGLIITGGDMAHLRPYARRALAAGLVALLALALGVAGVSAHEHREVGDYELTVGFWTEPAIVDEPNGLSLDVQLGHGDEGTPVEGLEETLQAEVAFGGQTMPLELSAAFGMPGRYRADFIPTEPGTYSFRIFGSIEGMELDETFTGGPDTFSEVESKDALNFPPVADSGAETAAAVTDAQDTADSARTLAIIGIIAGVIGIAVGVGGFMMARSARQSSGAPAASPGTAD
jgi:hypothetical protein